MSPEHTHAVSNGRQKGKRQASAGHTVMWAVSFNTCYKESNSNVRGIRGITVTCDGTGHCISSLEILGASLSACTLRTAFMHPSNPNWLVYAFPDPPHMMKNIWNALQTKETFAGSTLSDFKKLKTLMVCEWLTN